MYSGISPTVSPLVFAETKQHELTGHDYGFASPRTDIGPKLMIASLQAYVHILMKRHGNDYQIYIIIMNLLFSGKRIYVEANF